MPFLYTEKDRILKTEPQTQSKYWAVKGENLMFTWFEVPPHQKFEMHSHESEQITYVLDGALFFQIEKEIFRVESGDCIAVPANIPHAVWTSEAGARAVDAWAPVHETYA